MTMTTGAPPGRIASMDQFRGYTVAAMFAANFLGGLEAIHPVLKHHNTYFSYADSIMPSFIFASGFSFRLTILRRRAQLGAFETYRRAVGRSFGLILLSLVVFGFGESFDTWDQMTAEGVREFLAKLLKANLWEILAIIGATQLLILPVVAAGVRVRVATMTILLLAHVGLSHAFNFHFVYGKPNAFDALWGAARTGAWDGGLFGPLAWSFPMLAGTLVYDAVAAASPWRGSAKLLGWGLALMAVGYALSCATTLYDSALGASADAEGVAASPVVPPPGSIGARPLGSSLAEPPFVPPPPTDRRALNYWMMGKKVVSAPFVLFATGFALALYALFVLACDAGGLGWGLFRTFGQNPLAAYLIHQWAEHSLRALVPEDSPLWWCLVGFVAFFGVVYLFVRYLEKKGIFLRL
jgi:predicted acyltransferase